jgi:hypothetical protein
MLPCVAFHCFLSRMIYSTCSEGNGIELNCFSLKKVERQGPKTFSVVQPNA